MFGYSRGAYTVRSLIGLINHAGLVKRNHIDFADEAYKLYRRNPGVDSDEAIKFRKCHGDAIPIKCLVCFDTVGSLGIPQLFPAFFQRAFTKKYEFHDTKLSHNIEYAIHAVSIEEWRGGKFYLYFIFQHFNYHPLSSLSFITNINTNFLIFLICNSWMSIHIIYSIFTNINATM